MLGLQALSESCLVEFGSKSTLCGTPLLVPY